MSRPETPDAGTPGLRLIELLEQLAGLDRAFTLADAVQGSGWPKPTVHRMLQQLETGGLIAREPDGRRYQLGERALLLAETLMRGSTQQGLRRAVLRQLVVEVGESCNLTALAGAEVMYLDRVETAFPLRMELRPGSRVPMHCSASGKLFLAHMTPAKRGALVEQMPRERLTPQTITEPAALEAEFQRIRQQDYSVDAEEFIAGMVCVAVPVRTAGGNEVRMALALQAPAVRMPLEAVLRQVPALQRAAQAMARTWG
ncbi:IclR family transcriptional regulator [Rivibacter subsaxonicus]|uniref:IclR family transcriptional regulator n=1 Tax=Rivibacter subsaxonicus TaxID=457575 RepID=A0A4Q7VMU6_9BURK|nr:IclR family transcriptional regulator [Rivibacter subsaxonicus]RZT97622.1 IclR family transcriptional regulator [Rivibacter subsaxonicus]